MSTDQVLPYMSISVKKYPQISTVKIRISIANIILVKILSIFVEVIYILLRTLLLVELRYNYVLHSFFSNNKSYSFFYFFHMFCTNKCNKNQLFGVTIITIMII